MSVCVQLKIIYYYILLNNNKNNNLFIYIYIYVYLDTQSSSCCDAELRSIRLKSQNGTVENIYQDIPPKKPTISLPILDSLYENGELSCKLIGMN